MEISGGLYSILSPSYNLNLLSAIFTLQASRSYCICCVTAHSWWRTTTSCAVPRICSKLGSWITHVLLDYLFLPCFWN